MRPGILIHHAAGFALELLSRSFVGRIIAQAYFDRRDKSSSICFVAATRLREEDFWQKSLLGKRLKDLRNQPRIKIRIAFENRRGLPSVYNEAIAAADSSDVLVFIHDDAWLINNDSLNEIFRGLRKFDVLGIAGNTRRIAGQSTWYLRQLPQGGVALDVPFLSGAVYYGQIFKTELNQFGPWPAACELLDGVLLAARASKLRRTGLRFDERYDFHFYDLDFSRAARTLRMKIGTWPIHLLHGSKGNPGDERWKKNLQLYMEKWRS